MPRRRGVVLRLERLGGFEPLRNAGGADVRFADQRIGVRYVNGGVAKCSCRQQDAVGQLRSLLDELARRLRGRERHLADPRQHNPAARTLGRAARDRAGRRRAAPRDRGRTATGCARRPQGARSGRAFEFVEEPGDAFLRGDRSLGLGDRRQRRGDGEPRRRGGAENQLAHPIGIGLDLDEAVVDEIVGAVGARLEEGNEAVQPACRKLAALGRRQDAAGDLAGSADELGQCRIGHQLRDRRIAAERCVGGGIDFEAEGRLERRIEVVRRQEDPGVGALARRGHHRAGGQCVGEPGRVDARRRQATSRAECRLTIVQRERHAAHAGAGQPDRGHRYFEAQPAAGRRHVAHARARHGAVGAPGYQRAVAGCRPVRAVFPTAAAVPLQHQHTRRIVRIEISPRIQILTGRDRNY